MSAVEFIASFEAENLFEEVELDELQELEDTVEQREEEEVACCYSPNRHCEVILAPHVWDEMQFIFDEWGENVEAD